jgi:hypothetical protein
MNRNFELPGSGFDALPRLATQRPTMTVEVGNGMGLWRTTRPAAESQTKGLSPPLGFADDGLA